MINPKNIQKDFKVDYDMVNAERKLEPAPLSFSFSPSSKEKLKEFGKLYKDSLPVEKRERREVEKKVGKERGRRGKGKGCE